MQSLSSTDHMIQYSLFHLYCLFVWLVCECDCACVFVYKNACMWYMILEHDKTQLRVKTIIWQKIQDDRVTYLPNNRAKWNKCNLLSFSGLAYNEFLRDLQTCQSDLDYHVKKADRSISPRRPDYNRLYHAYCRENYGSRNGQEMFQQINSLVCSYKAEHSDASVLFQAYEETENSINPFIMVLITPLMRRVHQMVSKKLGGK